MHFTSTEILNSEEETGIWDEVHRSTHLPLPTPGADESYLLMREVVYCSALSFEMPVKFAWLYSVISHKIIHMRHNHCLENLKSHNSPSALKNTLLHFMKENFLWKVYSYSTTRKKIPFSGTIISAFRIRLCLKPFQLKMHLYKWIPCHTKLLIYFRLTDSRRYYLLAPTALIPCKTSIQHSTQKILPLCKKFTTNKPHTTNSLTHIAPALESLKINTDIPIPTSP